MSVEEHYTDVLSKISTADLVRELLQREGTDAWPVDPGEVFRFYFPRYDADHRGYGPATIIVIKRDVPEDGL